MAAHVVEVSIMEALAKDPRRLPKPGLALDIDAAGGGNTKVLLNATKALLRAQPAAAQITRALRADGPGRRQLKGAYSCDGRCR